MLIVVNGLRQIGKKKFINRSEGMFDYIKKLSLKLNEQFYHYHELNNF
jgi:hypothetical protein